MAHLILEGRGNLPASTRRSFHQAAVPLVSCPIETWAWKFLSVSPIFVKFGKCISSRWVNVRSFFVAKGGLAALLWLPDCRSVFVSIFRVNSPRLLTPWVFSGFLEEVSSGPPHSLQFFWPPADLISWYVSLERAAYCVGFHDTQAEYSSAFLQ